MPCACTSGREPDAEQGHQRPGEQDQQTDGRDEHHQRQPEHRPGERLQVVPRAVALVPAGVLGEDGDERGRDRAADEQVVDHGRDAVGGVEDVRVRRHPVERADGLAADQPEEAADHVAEHDQHGGDGDAAAPPPAYLGRALLRRRLFPVSVAAAQARPQVPASPAGCGRPGRWWSGPGSGGPGRPGPHRPAPRPPRAGATGSTAPRPGHGGVVRPLDVDVRADGPGQALGGGLLEDGRRSRPRRAPRAARPAPRRDEGPGRALSAGAPRRPR